MKRSLVVALLGAVALSLGGIASGTTGPPFPSGKIDLQSAPPVAVDEDSMFTIGIGGPS